MLNVISNSFKESGNLLFLMALLIQLVSLKKKISLFFSAFSGIYPAVTVSEGKFSQLSNSSLRNILEGEFFCLTWISG